MKIALISESPSVTTGFGTHARHLVGLLDELGHQTVVFGVCAEGIPFDPAAYPCRIVPMPRDQKEAIEQLGGFLAAERPDVLFVHYDLAAACRFIERARAEGWAGPIIAHIVIDGLPFNRSYLTPLRTIDCIITPTHTAARQLLSLGLTQTVAAPHPVDATLFRPLQNRAALRRAAGLERRFVVGVFGRNVERKQQPRVMLAVQHLVESGQGDDIVLYLHCQPRNEDPWLNAWDLADLAEQLGIADRVLFPPADFRQLDGMRYAPSEAALPVAAAHPAIPDIFGYVERLNLCDLVVNVPYSGAFELATLEAQLCGVPVAVTNDHGAIAEVAGDAALLLEPVDIGIHPSGGRQCFVSPQTIAAAISAVRADPALRADLVARGIANAQRYTLEPLRVVLSAQLASRQDNG